VWPENPPDFVGTLIDLDTGSTGHTEIGQNQFTVRINENATPTGYAWNDPPQAFECVTLDNTNYGDKITGY